MAGREPGGLVRAAGGVPWRRSDTGGLDVLLVHRPRYDDWTFPKGKLDPGETWEQGAVREVHEETGILAVLGEELVSTEYLDRHGRQKRVRYWAMTIEVDGGLPDGDEVDERRWMAPVQAELLLTYERDRAVLARFVAAVSESG